MKPSKPTLAEAQLDPDPDRYKRELIANVVIVIAVVSFVVCFTGFWLSAPR